jgi:nitroreductase
MDTLNENSLRLIFGRRSIRVFKDEQVTAQQIDLLLRAGMAAPSACAKDPWRFIVVRDQATREKMAAVMPAGKMISAAPLGIVVCGDEEAAFEKKEGFLIQDCSAAIQNILLASYGIGLGACWLAIYPKAERMQHVRDVYALKPNIIPVCCIAIGYPAEKKESRSRFNRDYVTYL